ALSEEQQDRSSRPRRRGERGGPRRKTEDVRLSSQTSSPLSSPRTSAPSASPRSVSFFLATRSVDRTPAREMPPHGARAARARSREQRLELLAARRAAERGREVALDQLWPVA